MTIEWSIFLSAVAVAATLFFNSKNALRQQRLDAQSETREITIVITKLDGIASSLAEMKIGFVNHEDEIKENRERLVKVEEATKSAHNLESSNICDTEGKEKAV